MTDDEMTPTQRASAELAERVFADPDLRDHFERAAKESTARPRVRDDFTWLTDKGEYNQFEELARKIISVPKSAIDAERGKDR